MKSKPAILCLLLASTPLAAQVVKLPEKIDTQVGRLAAIAIESDGKTTNWIVVPPTDIDAFREYDPDPKVIRVRVIAYRNGVFNLVAWTAKGDVPSKPISCVIQVGPAPSPTPVPPDPAPVPSPDSPLMVSLRAAFAKESDADKALAAKFADACERTANASAGLQLVKQVNDFYVDALKSAIGQACPNLRAAVNLELNNRLPRQINAPLDAASRATVVAVFKEISAALGALK